MMFTIEHVVSALWALLLLTAFGMQWLSTIKNVSNSHTKAKEEAKAEEKFREDFYA